MTLFSLLSTGILTLLLSLQGLPVAEAATPKPLYDRMKEGVERELASDKVEEEVVTFVRQYLESLGETVSDQNITDAVQHKDWSLCGTRSPGDVARSNLGCDELTSRIRIMVEREERVRRVGRSMQLITTSYELPISDLPGRSQQMAKDLRGIISIWSAGTGSTKILTATGGVKNTASGLLITLKTVDEPTIRPLMEELGQALNNLKTEERTAAIWRYQYGVRLVANNRAPAYPAPYQDGQSGPGTERQYLFKRWTPVEEALQKIWQKISTPPVSPTLSSTEIVVYTFPKDLMEELLPDNVLLWGRLDGGAGNPFGDAGLQWNIPLEPVLPSLTSPTDEAILGGEYPPDPQIPITPVIGRMDPVDGRGLCSDPTQRRGYLCRTFTPAMGKRCPVDPAAPAVDPAKISLVTCEDEETVRTTLSGPDVCRDIKTEENRVFNPDTECKIAFRCAANCGGLGGVAVQGITQLKNADGVIDVCINNSDPRRGMSSLILHELVHAYQFCTLPVGEDPFDPAKTREQRTAACCEIEGGGYRAQCDMAEEDGAFEDAADFIGPGGEEIPLNAETCTESLTALACAPDGYMHLDGCYQSRTYPQGFTDAIGARFDAIPLDLPFTCEDAGQNEDTMDPRIRDIKEAIQTRQDVCAPGQTFIYKNTIGNNMCYIGQCIEESTELHRVTGAQSPVTVGDQSFPWNNPQNGAPLGNALINPPITPGELPLYRPQLVVQELESALCQLQGLPPLTPSILCTYSPARRLMHPVIDVLSNAQSLLTDTDAQKKTTENTLALSLGLGSRLGTTLYADYMRLASHSLADVLGMAVKLFKEMAAIDFPTEMCPMDDSLPTPSSDDSGT